LPNPPAPPYRSGQLPGGNEEGEVEGVQSEGGENQEQEKGEQEKKGTVFGEQNQCQGWPLWIWVAVITAYAVLFLGSLFNNFKYHVKERKIRWAWPLILIIGAFLFWYNFDKCQEYEWFIISIAIGSVVFYLYYLSLLKRKTSEIK
jgi:hypothetical protein